MGLAAMRFEPAKSTLRTTAWDLLGEVVKKKPQSSKQHIVPSMFIRVGDLIHLMFGRRKIQGKVVEDRGKIGVKGRKAAGPCGGC